MATTMEKKFKLWYLEYVCGHNTKLRNNSELLSEEKQGP